MLFENRTMDLTNPRIVSRLINDYMKKESYQATQEIFAKECSWLNGDKISHNISLNQSLYDIFDDYIRIKSDKQKYNILYDTMEEVCHLLEKTRYKLRSKSKYTSRTRFNLGLRNKRNYDKEFESNTDTCTSQDTLPRQTRQSYRLHDESQNYLLNNKISENNHTSVTAINLLDQHSNSVLGSHIRHHLEVVNAPLNTIAKNFVDVQPYRFKENVLINPNINNHKAHDTEFVEFNSFGNTTFTTLSLPILNSISSTVLNVSHDDCTNKDVLSHGNANHLVTVLPLFQDHSNPTRQIFKEPMHQCMVSPMNNQITSPLKKRLSEKDTIQNLITFLGISPERRIKWPNLIQNLVEDTMFQKNLAQVINNNLQASPTNPNKGHGSEIFPPPTTSITTSLSGGCQSSLLADVKDVAGEVAQNRRKRKRDNPHPQHTANEVLVTSSHANDNNMALADDSMNKSLPLSNDVLTDILGMIEIGPEFEPFFNIFNDKKDCVNDEIAHLAPFLTFDVDDMYNDLYQAAEYPNPSIVQGTDDQRIKQIAHGTNTHTQHPPTTTSILYHDVPTPSEKSQFTQVMGTESRDTHVTNLVPSHIGSINNLAQQSKGSTTLTHENVATGPLMYTDTSTQRPLPRVGGDCGTVHKGTFHLDELLPSPNLYDSTTLSSLVNQDSTHLHTRPTVENSAAIKLDHFSTTTIDQDHLLRLGFGGLPNGSQLPQCSPLPSKIITKELHIDLGKRLTTVSNNIITITDDTPSTPPPPSDYTLYLNSMIEAKLREMRQILPKQIPVSACISPKKNKKKKENSKVCITTTPSSTKCSLRKEPQTQETIRSKKDGENKNGNYPRKDISGLDNTYVVEEYDSPEKEIAQLLATMSQQSTNRGDTVIPSSIKRSEQTVKTPQPCYTTIGSMDCMVDKCSSSSATKRTSFDSLRNIAASLLTTTPDQTLILESKGKIRRMKRSARVVTRKSLRNHKKHIKSISPAEKDNEGISNHDSNSAGVVNSRTNSSDSNKFAKDILSPSTNKDGVTAKGIPKRRKRRFEQSTKCVEYIKLGQDRNKKTLSSQVIITTQEQAATAYQVNNSRSSIKSGGVCKADFLDNLYAKLAGKGLRVVKIPGVDGSETLMVDGQETATNNHPVPESDTSLSYITANSNSSSSLSTINESSIKDCIQDRPPKIGKDNNGNKLRSVINKKMDKKVGKNCSLTPKNVNNMTDNRDIPTSISRKSNGEDFGNVSRKQPFTSVISENVYMRKNKKTSDNKNLTGYHEAGIEDSRIGRSDTNQNRFHTLEIDGPMNNRPFYNNYQGLIPSKETSTSTGIHISTNSCPNSFPTNINQSSLPETYYQPQTIPLMTNGSTYKNSTPSNQVDNRWRDGLDKYLASTRVPVIFARKPSFDNLTVSRDANCHGEVNGAGADYDNRGDRAKLGLVNDVTTVFEPSSQAALPNASLCHEIQQQQEQYEYKYVTQLGTIHKSTRSSSGAMIPNDLSQELLPIKKATIRNSSSIQLCGKDHTNKSYKFASMPEKEIETFLAKIYNQTMSKNL